MSNPQNNGILKKEYTTQGPQILVNTGFAMAQAFMSLGIVSVSLEKQNCHPRCEAEQSVKDLFRLSLEPRQIL